MSPDMISFGQREATYGFIIAVLTVIAWWRIFNKAGRPGIFSIIPIVNTWTLFDIAGLSGVTSVFGWIGGALLIGSLATSNTLLSTIAVIMLIVFVIQCLRLNFMLAHRFGHGLIFALGLIFLNTIFILILGFGADRYEYRI